MLTFNPGEGRGGKINLKSIKSTPNDSNTKQNHLPSPCL